MSDAQEPKVSSLSRTVKCQGQLLHVDIYEDGEGGWCLAVTNEQRVTSNWAESFKTERAALRAAMKTIKEEGPEGFGMEQPYKDALRTNSKAPGTRCEGQTEVRPNQRFNASVPALRARPARERRRWALQK